MHIKLDKFTTLSIISYRRLCGKVERNNESNRNIVIFLESTDINIVKHITFRTNLKILTHKFLRTYYSQNLHISTLLKMKKWRKTPDPT